MFKYLLALFASFSLAASPWVLDRKILEEHLKPEASVEELIKVLEGEGIEVQFKSPAEELLWKGGRVSISLASTPFVPYHLWIDVVGKETLDACTKEDFEELYRAIWMARKALKSTIGADGFMMIATEKHRNGKGSRWAGVEILPYPAGEAMDAREKADLNAYALYNDFPLRSVSQSPTMVAAIRELLPNLSVEVEPEEPQEGWTQKLLRHKEAVYHSLETIHETLVGWGALSSGTLPPAPPPEDEILENRIDLLRCAFCVPKVIQKQLVSDWKEIYVFLSHKPISPYGNFLILTKRHQCAWDLTMEEAVSFFEAAAAVKRMLVKKSGSDNCILYIQDGPGVGQTVPHTHMHIFIVPPRVKNAIAGIEHIRNKRPILGEREIRDACEMYQPLFLEELSNLFRLNGDEEKDDAGKREDR